jgi:hypothetical protein
LSGWWISEPWSGRALFRLDREPTRCVEQGAQLSWLY